MASKRSKYEIKLDVQDAIQGLDGDYNDDLGLKLSIGSDSEDEALTVGQVFYDDGTEAELEVRVKVTNVKRAEVTK